MWGVDRSVVRRALISGLLVLALAGCSGPEYLPVPTFPGPQVAVGGAGTGVVPGDAGLPDDCERVLPAADLVALLGLPLDSVAVRTTLGVPEPSVGRLERVACRYTGTSGGVRGATLLELNAGRYVDDASATRQWRVNSAAEGGARRGLPLGTAPGILIERPAEALFTVVNRDVALTMTLPASAPRAPGRSTADTLVDLALRVLATATPPQAPARPPAAAR